MEHQPHRQPVVSSTQPSLMRLRACVSPRALFDRFCLHVHGVWLSENHSQAEVVIELQAEGRGWGGGKVDLCASLPSNGWMTGEEAAMFWLRLMFRKE